MRLRLRAARSRKKNSAGACGARLAMARAISYAKTILVGAVHQGAYGSG